MPLNQGFAGVINRFVGFLLVITLLGWANGFPLVTTLCALLGYLAWSAWNLFILSRWVLKGSPDEPPDLVGVWGEMVDSVLRLHKKQRRERLRLQGVIRRGQETTAALKDGIVLVDADLHITWFNASAQQLLGLRAGDIGNPVFNFIRHPQFRHYLHSGKFQDMLDLPSPQNSDVRLQYQVSAYGQGEMLVVVRDITRVHKLEAMRKDFVANLSHELKTPLTVIRGYVETINMSNGMPEKWRPAMEQVESQTLRMTSLIEDLTQLSKLETNDTHLAHRPVKLQGLLNQVAADAKSLSGSKRHNIRVLCPSDLECLGVEKELRSAFSNLAFNAVKYSPAGSDVEIGVKLSALGLAVSIKDNGPGIDGSHLPRLTERFYRVDSSRNSDTGGTGLGLAIVKHVMIRHGGSLEIDSKPGVGSTFTCLFPKQKVIQGGEAQVSTPPPPQKVTAP